MFLRLGVGMVRLGVGMVRLGVGMVRLGVGMYASTEDRKMGPSGPPR